MAAAGRDPTVTVGVVRAPSSDIELVLKQISLPVAQIRVICKNGPQVSIDDIKLKLLSGLYIVYLYGSSVSAFFSIVENTILMG
jgi:hypothetical protein